jgi:hypothetical protein
MKMKTHFLSGKQLAGMLKRTGLEKSKEIQAVLNACVMCDEE